VALTPARRSLIEPFHVMEVVAAAAAQEARTGDVLHLEVGQPSTGAPASAVAAASALLGSGHALGYTQACGIDPLRERIAALHDERYGLTIDPARVIVTAGASAAVVLTLLASFDVGARVVVTEPGYPCYRQIITALGLVPVPVRIGADNGFLLTAAAMGACIEQHGAVDGVLVASPANPTGTVYDAETLGELRSWCARHGVRLIADEIYHGITFGDAAPTALGPDGPAGPTEDGVVTIGSFSKYFSMTGWRLGWMIAPDELIEPVDRLSQNLYLSPPTLAQHAALAAFDDAPELDGHVVRYAENRRIMLAALDEMGIADRAPCDGAFYLYGDVSRWGIDSQALVELWLRDLGVATAPGIDFDPVEGRRWIRWSVAGSTETVTEAARRLVGWSRTAAVAGRTTHG
jgi:aspartate/methionine/tyrosine aminotransferase